MPTRLHRSTSINNPLFTFVFGNKNILFRPNLSEFPGPGSWIRAQYRSARKSYDIFSYNVQTLQVASKNDAFSDDLGFLALNSYEEFLKFKNLDLYNGIFFDKKYKKYKMTPSALIYIYFMFCKDKGVPFNLSLDKYLFKENMISIKDRSIGFDVVVDVKNNCVYTDKDFNSIELINKK